MVSILLLAFGVSILILPQGNVTCYLEGIVMGRHKFRVSLNFVSSVSAVRSYLRACTVVFDEGFFTKITIVVNPVGVRQLQKTQ